MRSEYGKLIYMLQDSMLPHVQELLNFKVVKPMTTVHSYLADRDAEDLLTDPLMALATREILSEGKSRHEVSKEVCCNYYYTYHICADICLKILFQFERKFWFFSRVWRSLSSIVAQDYEY